MGYEEVDKRLTHFIANDFAHLTKVVRRIDKKQEWILGVLTLLVPIVIAVLGVLLARG